MAKKRKRVDLEKYERFSICELNAAKEVMKAIDDSRAEEIAEAIEARRKEWGDLTYAREVIDDDYRYGLKSGNSWFWALERAPELGSIDLKPYDEKIVIAGKQNYFVLKYKENFEKARRDKALSLDSMPEVYRDLLKGHEGSAMIRIRGKGWIGVDKKDLNINNYVPRLEAAKEKLFEEWGEGATEKIKDEWNNYFRGLEIGFALGALEEGDIKLAKEIFDKIGADIKEKDLLEWVKNKEKYILGTKSDKEKRT